MRINALPGRLRSYFTDCLDALTSVRYGCRDRFQHERFAVVSDCAVSYVSSVDYLLPTVISALGIKKYVPDHIAKIYIFLDAADDYDISFLSKHLEARGILLVRSEFRRDKNLKDDDFEGYITSTTLGRFYVADMLPESVKRIVYIDGDTLIWGNPSALIEMEIPEGRFAAAEDTLSFRRNPLTKKGRQVNDYFRGLGVRPDSGYCNLGVFAVSRDTWNQLASEALRFFRDNRDRCICLDQSALNAVVGDRRLKLSLKWNFQSPAKFMGAEQHIRPIVLHFTQYIKPWMGHCKPWEDIFPFYREAGSALAELSLKFPNVAETEIASHNRLNPLKSFLLKNQRIASLSSIYTNIPKYEREAWL